MQHKQFFDEQFSNLEKLLREDTQSFEVVCNTVRSLKASAKILLSLEEHQEVLDSRHLIKSLLNQSVKN